VIPTDTLAVRVELAQGPGVLVQFRDIKREQEIERELRLTTSYVDALAHHTSTVALMLDGTGAIRFATDTAVELIGAIVNEPLGPLASYGRLRLEGRPSTWAERLHRAGPVTGTRPWSPAPAGALMAELATGRMKEQNSWQLPGNPTVSAFSGAGTFSVATSQGCAATRSCGSSG
jgi:two-component system sensor kinase FixL